jgi:hypothetical protein
MSLAAGHFVVLPCFACVLFSWLRSLGVSQRRSTLRRQKFEASYDRPCKVGIQNAVFDLCCLPQKDDIMIDWALHCYDDINVFSDLVSNGGAQNSEATNWVGISIGTSRMKLR